MKPVRALALASLALAAAAPPAAAIGLPSLDMPAGQVALHAGPLAFFYIVPMPFGMIEWAPTDRLAVGAGTSGWMAYGFGTWRFATLPGGAHLGLMAAGGFNDERAILGTVGPVLAAPAFTGPVPGYYYNNRIFRGPWGQAALAAAWPIGPMVLRATFGPVGGSEAVFVGAMKDGESAVPLDMRPAIVFMPNVELGIRIGDRHEITLGGIGLIGWRGRF